MRTLVVPAPAKLNLFLHVTGRRDDGYHTIETLFVALDFGDTIALTVRADGAIRRLGADYGVPPERDLAVRAASALQRASGCADGVDIAVTKRIPMGSGLGGGSSDAATVLLALNRLWELGMTRAELSQIAVALGADVPFFLSAEPALARGIGERLTPVTIPSFGVGALIPRQTVSRATIFAAPELTRNGASAKTAVFSEGYGRNDLQSPAVSRVAEIATALAVLSAHSALARMTGSGGCVFAPFATEAQAHMAIAARPSAMHGFVARTLARHPLAGFA
jgi:4-diphosphocytidyl-2-C-methyl-D-erythritol kinase